MAGLKLASYVVKRCETSQGEESFQLAHLHRTSHHPPLPAVLKKHLSVYKMT